MKITKLHIQGFRSLRDVTWQPGDLNVVIGPNGSGKSNLLALLEMMAVSAQGGLGKHVQSLGGMDALVWDGQAESISCEIESLHSKTLTVPEPPQLYMLALQRLGHGSAYVANAELLLGLPDVVAGTPPRYMARNDQSASYMDEDGQFRAVAAEQLSADESLLSLLRTGIAPHIRQFQRELASISIYRFLDTGSDAAVRRPVITRMEQRVAADGQNLISVLHTLYTGDRQFKSDINAAMRTAFGDDFEELVFPPAADQRIQLRVRWKSLKREQSAADLSDGTLRFLYLLAILASPNPAPVIAIDEPETGLHPSMLPVIAEFAVDAATRAQVILTTHSPQMLDAFGSTRPTTTVAQWRNGETVLHTIKDADLDYWLKEYTLGNLFKSGELEQMA